MDTAHPRFIDTATEPIPNMIGTSDAFQRAIATIRRISRFDVPVLLKGETGTGKELAARAIHYLSARRDRPFVPLNCGSLPDTLAESELFGCEPGAFTDARTRRSGIISAAEGGTLFLDEVDSLPARAQTSLLRFLQDCTYRPLGATRERVANVRVVAAAGSDLGQLVAARAFRADLVYRLEVLTVDMPPLRERTGDALVLANHFARRYARQYGLDTRPIGTPSIEWMSRYAWPGNVRELENLVLRRSLLCTHSELSLIDDSDSPTPPSAPSFYASARAFAIRAWEHGYLCDLLARAGGNVTHAATLAGKERRALGKLIKKHGLDRRDYVA